MTALRFSAPVPEAPGSEATGTNGAYGGPSAATANGAGCCAFGADAVGPGVGAGSACAAGAGSSVTSRGGTSSTGLVMRMG